MRKQSAKLRFVAEGTAHRQKGQHHRHQRNSFNLIRDPREILARSSAAVIAAIYKELRDRRPKFGARAIWPIFPCICEWPRLRSRDRYYHRGELTAVPFIILVIHTRTSTPRGIPPCAGRAMIEFRYRHGMISRKFGN
jgi:hypothetical protein